jgi:ATP-dependent DNA ligase
MWQIGFDPSISSLHYIHGTILTAKGVQGKIRERRTIAVELNNSGRNLLVQALLQARRKYTDKYRLGYRPAGVARSGIIDAQLANTYRPPGTINPKSGKEQRSQLTPAILKRGIALDPKMDGIRGRIFNDAYETTASPYNSIRILSRTNNEFGYLNHIRDELQDLFMYLPHGAGLDSELYTWDLTFTKLTSAIKTEKFCHENNGKVKAFIFDLIIENVVFEERKEILERAIERYLADGHVQSAFLLVPHIFSDNADDVKFYHDKWVEEGYEGIMIRKLGRNCRTEKERAESYYKAGRNNNLLKHKSFIDEEGTCIGVLEGKDNEKGLAILMIRDIRGNEIPMRPRGSHETRREWFEHPEMCIGKPITFRYQELSEYNVPRFPVAIGVRDYE